MFRIEGVARNITLSGNRETCPRCGEWAELPEGTFDVAGDTIEVLSAAALTRERLLRLAEILESARAGRITDDEAAQAVADEAPTLVPLLERFSPRMRHAFVVFLLAVIQILLAQGLAELRDDSATRQEVRDAVQDAVERCLHERP